MFTKTFRQLSKADVAIAGGKGASLGEMTKAKIPVPPGFVILAPAFERFIAATDINTEIEARLHELNHRDTASVEKMSADIEALIRQADFPNDLNAEITKAFAALKSPYVAVRSSATAEDSSTASWAGELETYLNVTKKI